MTKEEKDINPNIRDPRIKRSPHDKQNPYTMINSALIRDETLSPECRWLLIYLLSNTDTWEIRVQQVINHLKPHMGRDKVRRLFAEAVTAGYMERQTVLISLESGGKLKRFDYQVAESPIFKKCFRCTENQGPDNQDADDQSTGDPTLSNNKRKEETKKEKTKESSSSTPTPQPPASDPSSNAAAAAPRLENGVKKAFLALSEDVQEKIIKKFWEDNASTPIKNTQGWFAKHIRERWWEQEDFVPPPPPEPESVVNKRENTKFAKLVIEKLECCKELNPGFSGDFLRITHTKSGSDLVNLAESPYGFRTRVFQILRRFKISPELYLLAQVEPEEAKKEETPPI